MFIWLPSIGRTRTEEQTSCLQRHDDRRTIQTTAARITAAFTPPVGEVKATETTLDGYSTGVTSEIWIQMLLNWSPKSIPSEWM